MALSRETGKRRRTLTNGRHRRRTASTLRQRDKLRLVPWHCAELAVRQSAFACSMRSLLGDNHRIQPCRIQCRCTEHLGGGLGNRWPRQGAKRVKWLHRQQGAGFERGRIIRSRDSGDGVCRQRIQKTNPARFCGGLRCASDDNKRLCNGANRSGGVAALEGGTKRKASLSNWRHAVS